jgi:hypothetical protein
MRLSAELRWFWEGEPTIEFERWFAEAGQDWHAARPTKTRLDDYLADRGQSELGIKKRSGGSIVEVKGFIAARNQTLTFSHCTASVELWAKWPSFALDLSCVRLITIEKRRSMRTFRPNGAGVRELPPTSEEPRADTASACNVELTRISGPDGTPWWTLGLEAFGALEQIEALLAATLAEMEHRKPPPLTNGQACSYPAWIAIQGW